MIKETEKFNRNPKCNCPVAVIDIGSSSIRMDIAEVSLDGTVRMLDSLQQEVSLGSDTFTQGTISQESIENCVTVLKSFKTILNEYHIYESYRVRAVATSAVREALNRDTVLDRLYLATGINVVAIDDAEVNRYTYISLSPYLRNNPSLKSGQTIIVEVGAGSTELMLLKHGKIAFSHSYRLGSLRMRENFEQHGAPEYRMTDAMRIQIDNTIGSMSTDLPTRGRISFLAIGGVARFAASHLVPGAIDDSLTRIPVQSLNNFTERLIKLSTDELVQQYHLSFPDAETVIPSLLTYLRMAHELKTRYIYVSHCTMRDGILVDITGINPWVTEIEDQVLNSALQIGKKYQYDEAHAKKVCDLSRTLFDALKREHQLNKRDKLILSVASLLHEIGLFVSNRNHHKHAMYLIANSSIFGLNEHEVRQASLVARYHRKSLPKPSHSEYVSLLREQRITVNKLASILRIADALDRSHHSLINDFTISIDDNKLIIAVPEIIDLTLEQLALSEKGNMLQQVYGLEVHLQTLT